MVEDVKTAEEQNQTIVFEDEIGKDSDKTTSSLDSLANDDPLAQFTEEENNQEDVIITEEGSVIINDAPEAQEDNATIIEEVRDDAAEVAQVKEPEIEIEADTKETIDQIVEQEGNKIENPEPELEQTQEIEPAEIETKAPEAELEAEPVKLEEQEIVFEEEANDKVENPLESLNEQDPLAQLAEEENEDSLASLAEENEAEVPEEEQAQEIEPAEMQAEDEAEQIQEPVEIQDEATAEDEAELDAQAEIDTANQEQTEAQEGNDATIIEEVRDNAAEAAQVKEPENEIVIEDETKEYLDQVVEQEGNEIENPEPEMAPQPKQKTTLTKEDAKEKIMQFVPQFVKDEEDKLASLDNEQEQQETITFESEEQSVEQTPEETLAEAKEILAESEEIMVAEGMRSEEEAALFQQELAQVEQNQELSNEDKTTAELALVQGRAAENENIVIENLDVRKDITHTADENIQIAAIKCDLEKSPDEYGNTKDINNPDRFSTSKLVNNAANLNLILGTTEKQAPQIEEHGAIDPKIEVEPVEVIQAKEKLQEKSDLDLTAENMKQQYGDSIVAVPDIKQAIKDTKSKIYDEQRFPEHLDKQGNLTKQGKEDMALACAYDMTDEKLDEETRTKIANDIKDNVGAQLAEKDAEGKNALQGTVEKDAALATEKEGAAALIANHEKEKAEAKTAEQEGQELAAETPSREPLKEPIKDSETFIAMSKEANTQLKQEKTNTKDTPTAQKEAEELNTGDEDEKEEAKKPIQIEVNNEKRGIAAKAYTHYKDGKITISSDGSAKEIQQAFDNAGIANLGIRNQTNEENKDTLKEAAQVTADMSHSVRDGRITNSEEHKLEQTFKNVNTKPGLVHDIKNDIDTMQEAQDSDNKNLNEMTPLEMAEFLKMRDQKNESGYSGGREA